MKYRIKEDILWKIVDGEVVMVSTEKEQYSYLNPTGTEIWKMINDEYTKDEMAKEIKIKYETSGQKLNKDIDEIIEKLLEQGLIEEIAGK
ncbi:PqqD family protein [Elusimicrobiota bacterium]